MLSLVLATTIAQAAPAPPPETKQFAFWVGEWTCEGTMYGKPNTQTKGTNRITMDMGGHVVHEHFAMPGFNGESWSVFNAPSKKWQQTWVDDSGGYIVLRGGWKDGKMTLTTIANPAKPLAFSRMVFSKISQTGFDWDWESSQDGGKKWDLKWHLRYTRK
jgi:hypothetical protein